MNSLFMPVLQASARAWRGWGVVFFFLCFAADSAHADPSGGPAQPSVTIVLSERGGSYEEFSNALGLILSSRGISHRVTDTAGLISASDPAAPADPAPASNPAPSSNLVIAVGMKAATAVAASDAPAVLNVLITRAGHNKFLREFPRRADSRAYSAIYLDQPLARQARVIAAVLPGKRNIGLLYSTAPAELAQLQQELHAQGLTLHAQAADPALPVSEPLQAVLERSDALLAVPDAAVYNDSTIRNILLATYRAGIPLIGFSPGYVRAGALYAVFSTPGQIAAQAAAVVLQFEHARALRPPQYPQEFEVIVNEQVARSLGLQVKSASALHDEIDSENKEAP